MIRTMTASEAKTHLLSLLDEVAAGEVIEITKHGRPVARLVGAATPISARDRLAGLARTVVDEEQLFRTGERWDAS